MSIGIAPNLTGNLLAGEAGSNFCDQENGSCCGPFDFSPWCCNVSDGSICDPTTAVHAHCCKCKPDLLCCLGCDSPPTSGPDALGNTGTCILPPGPGIIRVDCRTAAAPDGVNVYKLAITCDELAQFETSVCGYVNFYYLIPTVYHFRTPGGVGHLCVSDPFDHNWGAAERDKNVSVPPDYCDILVVEV